MNKIWKNRFIIMIVIGQILVWFNITGQWHNSIKFVLWGIGMLISCIGIFLQIIIAPSNSKSNIK